MRAIVLVAVTSMVGCADAPEKLAFPVPPGALEAAHVTLQAGVASQDSFFIHEKFPGSSALTHYERVFSDWRSCYWDERGWDTVPDASVTPPRLIHRRVRFWVAPTNAEWVMVSLQYESPGLAHRVAPTDERQYVVVAIRTSQDATQDLAALDVKCDEAPSPSPDGTRGN